MSHSPLVLETFSMFYKTLMKGTLDGKLRELAYIKASVVNDCAYCADAHKGVARKLAITDEQLQALNSYESSNLFTPVEKLVLKYAEELTKTAKSSESLLQDLKKHLSEEQLIELNLTVGTANLTNRFNMSFMTDPD
jgi:AhpD family alkylhydroperoxidase